MSDLEAVADLSLKSEPELLDLKVRPEPDKAEVKMRPDPARTVDGGAMDQGAPPPRRKSFSKLRRRLSQTFRSASRNFEKNF